MEKEEMVPPQVLKSLATLDSVLQSLETQLRSMLTLSNNTEAMSLLSPLDRASFFLALSKILNILFTLHLKSKGELINNQSIISELDRLGLYEDKVDRYIYTNKAPLGPSSALDVQAVNRFIGHAIPDLTEEQKKAINEISKEARGYRNEHGRLQRHRKRSTNKSNINIGRSIAEEASAFLVKAREELLAAKNKIEDVSAELQIDKEQISH